MSCLVIIVTLILMYLKGLYHQRRVELEAKTFTISLLAQTKSLI